MDEWEDYINPILKKNRVLSLEQKYKEMAIEYDQYKMSKMLMDNCDYTTKIYTKTPRGNIFDIDGEYFFEVDGESIKLDFNNPEEIGNVITSQVAKSLLK